MLILPIRPRDKLYSKDDLQMAFVYFYATLSLVSDNLRSRQLKQRPIDRRTSISAAIGLKFQYTIEPNKSMLYYELISGRKNTLMYIL